jgi:processive 1,2-diacylglycerol beta-glucosyltransferase
MITLKNFAEDQQAQRLMQERLASLPLSFSSDLFVNLLLNEMQALAD